MYPKVRLERDTPCTAIWLTRREFEKWRKAHPGAGEKGDSERCPIALCLRAKGNPDAWVSWSEWGRQMDEDVPQPKWVHDFVQKFDGGKSGGREGSAHDPRKEG